MIVVYHSSTKVDEVVKDNTRQIPFDSKASVAVVLSKLAHEFSLEPIIWCHSVFKHNLQLADINTLFHHDRMMLSYHPGESDFLGESIGYIEEFSYLNINKKVTYSTWRMSGAGGVLHASLLIELENKIVKDTNFDYYLNSLAKLCMARGLMCYSEPKLFDGLETNLSTKTSSFTLFRFAKQHYKFVWVFLLLLNLILYERRFPFIPFLCSLFFKNRKATRINLEHISVTSSKTVVKERTVDVLIPTIGRKECLYDFLIDLKQQTVLPSSVIIVEQNPELGSSTELTYLKDESWPFRVIHTFIHQTGVCNARNIALNQVTAEWVFFADDDIRISNTLIEDTLHLIAAYGTYAASLQSFRPNTNPVHSVVRQWHSFGGGSSFVASTSLQGCTYSMGFESGYGEDNDFGAQLTKKGFDVLYFPKPSILHLKAPMGGFRTKRVSKWQDEIIQPKPSPTYMLHLVRNYSKQQLWGYKTTLYFKYYKVQKIKNPIRYFINFKKQWNQSAICANELKKIG